jgi:uncharacterized iron-regulated protein
LPPSTRRFASATVAALAVALAGCVGAPVHEATSGTGIVDVAKRRFVDEGTLVDALAGVRFRLLGELHDDPEHHAIRARLVSEIAARGPRPAVVFEQFDLEHDAALVAARAPGATAESLAAAGRLDRNGWRWPMHEPIVAAALAAHLPIRAGNLSRAGMSTASAANAAPSWRARLRAAPWSDAQQEALAHDIVESHCNMLPASVVPRLVESERMRDAAMADAHAAAATADGAILVAGNGHVRANLGVPVYLHAPGFAGEHARVIGVGFVEADPEDLHGDGTGSLIAAHPGFDYLYVTPRIERPDPCAEFRPSPQPSPR